MTSGLAQRYAAWRTSCGLTWSHFSGQASPQKHIGLCPDPLKPRLTVGQPMKSSNTYLRSRVGFHGFQNINFAAKLRGQFSADLFERDLAGVKKSRHRSGGMTHLLTNNGGFYPASSHRQLQAHAKWVLDRSGDGMYH